MSEQAKCAIRAAKNRSNWGRWATMRYLAKRGVPFGLYRLAAQLESVERSSRLARQLEVMA